MSDPIKFGMPLYRSHKQVRALEIKEVQRDDESMRVRLIFVDSEHPLNFIPNDPIFARYKPQPGDFFVVYEDGYQSFSPAQAFREGYTRV
jgi:hypothetical protein